LNVLGGVPTINLDYGPMWRVFLVKWTDEAIRKGCCQRPCCAVWRNTLSEMGVVVASSSIAIGPIEEALDNDDQRIGAQWQLLGAALPQFFEDLTWWAEAAKAQRARREPPY
jgi:hypothetical protein